MYHDKSPPPYPGQLTVALFGKSVQLKNDIGKMILNKDRVVVSTSDDFFVEENNDLKIINTPDFFDEECLHPDQLIIDFMAHSHPGPTLFILAIDSENAQEKEVMAQIHKLKDIFGEEITAHMVVTVPDLESFHLLNHLTQRFNTKLTVPNENLASECRKWCLPLKVFKYDYKDYSEDVVRRRMTALDKRSEYENYFRHDGHPLCHHWKEGTNPMTLSTSQHAFAVPDRAAPPDRAASLHSAASPEHHNGYSPSEVSDDIFNIVLLGLTGTGKSASGNTILAPGNSQLDPRQQFKSESSSMPVTKQCEVKIVEKPFGRPVRVVDTPDFLDDELRNSQTEIEKCKKYCQPGRCVVLLVLQLGRITDREDGILQKLEDKLGWKIRESTFVLLTHGDDHKGNLLDYINTHDDLKSIIDQCSYRYHLFNNNSTKSKQVMELIKKIQTWYKVFPNFGKKNTPECCVS